MPRAAPAGGGATGPPDLVLNAAGGESVHLARER